MPSKNKSGWQWREQRRRRGLLTPDEYARERARSARRSREDRTRKVTYLRRIKLERGCADCGYNEHPAALDFDHLPGQVKVADISVLLRKQGNLVALQAEIAKYEVVCANCHRIRTFERGQTGGKRQPPSDQPTLFG